MNILEIPAEVFASADGVRSEQAMVQSAPSPSSLLFELNVIVSFFAFEPKLFGPLFWQNLGNTQ